jgi:hypothetical protein
MTAVEVLRLVDEPTDGKGDSVDAVMGADRFWRHRRLADCPECP